MKNEVAHAMAVLREYCENNSTCIECPFVYKKDCRLQLQPPCDWRTEWVKGEEKKDETSR